MPRLTVQLHRVGGCYGLCNCCFIGLRIRGEAWGRLCGRSLEYGFQAQVVVVVLYRRSLWCVFLPPGALVLQSQHHADCNQTKHYHNPNDHAGYGPWANGFATSDHGARCGAA